MKVLDNLWGSAKIYSLLIVPKKKINQIKNNPQSPQATKSSLMLFPFSQMTEGLENTKNPFLCFPTGSEVETGPKALIPSWIFKVPPPNAGVAESSSQE